MPDCVKMYFRQFGSAYGQIKSYRYWEVALKIKLESHPENVLPVHRSRPDKQHELIQLKDTTCHITYTLFLLLDILEGLLLNKYL